MRKPSKTFYHAALSSRTDHKQVFDQTFEVQSSCQNPHPSPAPNQAVFPKPLPPFSSFLPKGSFLLPWLNNRLIIGLCLALFATILWSQYLSTPLNVLEGLWQAVVYGFDSMCESGWSCSAQGDVTRWGTVR